MALLVLCEWPSMLDGVILGLSPDGIRIQRNETYVKASRLEEVLKIENPRGGSSLTIGFNQDKVIVKANPVSWLSCQNIFGSNHAWNLCIALLKDLKKSGVMRFDEAAWSKVLEGEYDIHQLAFNTYVNAGPNKFAMMDLIKSIYGSVASNTRLDSNLRWFMYPGHGMIVNNRSLNLTIYDKVEQMEAKHPNWTHELIPDLSILNNYLRVEATVKYSWFSKQKRRMSYWRDADWDKDAKTLITKALETFGFNYVMNCPNVFAPDFAKRWSDRDKALLAGWRKDQALPQKEASRLFRRHGFNPNISLKGHRNILWALARPDSVTRPVTVDIANTRTFPGTELLAPIYPMQAHFVDGASQKLLRRVDRACGLTKARD
jgi:hypothetical protein